jgi:two-component system, cell cycle response regulator
MVPKSAVVLVDYDKKRLDKYAQALTGAGIRVAKAASGEAALDYCRKTPPLAVISEAMITGGNGFELMRALRAEPATAKVLQILAVDEGDSYTLNRAQIAGLDGILIKPFTPEALVARVQGLLSADQRAATPKALPADVFPILKELENRARTENPLLPHLTDPVTGLWNLHYTNIKLAEEFKKARRFAVPLTSVALSIDENAGDAPVDDQTRRQLLTELAGLLLCESRDIDHLARLDDRSFLIILPHTDEHGALTMANRVLAAIEKRELVIPGRTRPITASAGIGRFSKDQNGPDDLVKSAHDALMRAIALGGNRVEVAARDPQGATR